MDDARGMRGGKGAGRLNRDLENFNQLHGRVPHAVAQSFAIDELGSDEVHRIDLPDLVNRDDVTSSKSLRKRNLLQQFLKTWIVAQRIEARINSQECQLGILLVISPLQPLKRLLTVFQPYVNYRDPIR